MEASSSKTKAGQQGVAGQGTPEGGSECSQEVAQTWEGTGLGSVCEVSRSRPPWMRPRALMECNVVLEDTTLHFPRH